RRRGRPPRRGLARRPALRREPAWDPPLHVEEPRPEGGRARAPALALVAPPACRRLPRRARRELPRGRPAPRLGRRARAPQMIVDYVRLAFATGVVLLPGFLIARALGQRSASAGLAWAFLAMFAAWAVVFAVHGTIRLAAGILAGLGVSAGVIAVRGL